MTTTTALVGGWHRPSVGDAAPGLHAVGPTDRFGARRSACGLIGRFLPAPSGWEPFPSSGADRCGPCAARVPK